MGANVFLVKHGEAIISNLKGHLPVSASNLNVLSEAGLLQMKKVSEEFIKLKKTFTIFSSPSPQVIDSAKILASALGINYESNDLLGDRLQSIDGFTVDEYRATQNFAASHPYTPTKGGETFLEQRTRVLSWFTLFINNLKHDENYIIISHGTTIEHLQSFLLNQPLNSSAYFFTACYPGRFHHWIGHKLQNFNITWELVTSNTATIIEETNSQYNSDELKNWALEQYDPQINTPELGNEILLQNDFLAGDGSGAAYHR